ncbi:MAG TPA: hypothetical protein VLT82_17000 [Myxococcaceae bacterium]|nr:hypothetical protein [Myxococcaceae bacterium]
MSTKLPVRACSALTMLALAACASTEFKNTWKAPDAAPLSVKPGDVVVTMVMSKEETIRRSGEDHFSDELRQRGLRPISSYTLIPTPLVDDRARAEALIRSSGAVAVFVVRLVAIDKEQRYMPTTYMGPGPGFGSFYAQGWGFAYGGYYVTDTVVKLETLVFDLRQDKLIWAGQSETTNPDRLEDFVREVVKVGVAELRKEGVITVELAGRQS